MTFIKNEENFVCERCGREVLGNGYTNHCPACMYSKHVDIDPGDRAATCGGMMRPTFLEQEKGEWVVTHTCVSCGHKKRNKVSPEDNFQVAIREVQQASIEA